MSIQTVTNQHSFMDLSCRKKIRCQNLHAKPVGDSWLLASEAFALLLRTEQLYLFQTGRAQSRTHLSRCTGYYNS